VQFVPICAELVALEEPDYGSPWLAARLNQTFNGDRGIRLQLTGIPAFIPKRYKETKARAIREYIRETASYEKIFIGSDCYVDQIDALITSVRHRSGERQHRGVSVGGRDRHKDASGSVGRRHRRHLDSEAIADGGQKNLVDEINKTWTGLNLDRLATIARRAASGRNRGGNVVVAFGREKVGSIVQTIRMGLVNELISTVTWKAR
jgi:hypothetical protein